MVFTWFIHAGNLHDNPHLSSYVALMETQYIVSPLSSPQDDIKSFPTCLGLPSSCPEWHLYSDWPRGCGGCWGWETLLKRCICKWCGLCEVAQSPGLLNEGFLQRVTETSWCGCHIEVTTPEHGTDSRSCLPVCWEESGKETGGGWWEEELFYLFSLVSDGREKGEWKKKNLVWEGSALSLWFITLFQSIMMHRHTHGNKSQKFYDVYLYKIWNTRRAWLKNNYR